MNVTNVVRAVVKPGSDYTVTSPIMKENKGQILLIEGLDLPEIYEIDFSNDRHHGTSVTMIGNADGVLIPTQFIKTGRDVYAFYYYVGDNFGQTEHIFRLPNDFRPDRTDEEPEPEQQSTIDQAIAAVNEAVVKTEENKTAAKNSVDSAKDDADRAERARDAAEGHSRDAGNAANRADTSERNAKGYSEDAGRSAEQASTSEHNAANSAAEAGRKADEITGLTVEAETLTPGSEATADYQNGQLVLGIPRGDKGEKGDTGATGPRGVQGIQGVKGDKGDTGPKGDKGDQGIQGIQGPKGDKGDTGPQGVKGDTGEQGIQGEQGERGLTGATGATGATPNLTIGTVETLEPTEPATASITGAPENPVLNLGIPQGDTGEVTLEEFYKAFPTDSASGSIASFPDGADGIPLKSLVVNINPVQDLSNGDPSPENICPISGWTGANVKHWSKNWIENASDTYSLTSSQFAKYTPSASLKNTTSGTFSVSANVPSGQTLRLFGYDGRNNGPINTFVRQSDGRYSVTSNSTTFKNTIEFRIYSQPYTGGSSVVTEISDATLVVNDTATAYEPHQGHTIPISWQSEAGTVYGGKLDVLNGKLTVDRAMVDLGTLPWSVNSTGVRFYGTSNSTVFPYKMGMATKMLCSVYKYDGYGTTARGYYGDNGTFRYAYTTAAFTRDIYIHDDSKQGMTGDEFKTAMSGVQLVYELAEPIEIQLTPNQVNSLLGANNIWADTGDTEVEYRADTKLYIEKLTQPGEDDMVADSAISSGQFFMVGNSLYRALANIASGATITVGTNAQRVSLADALNLVNA